MITRTNIRTVSGLLGSILLAVFFSAVPVASEPALENLESGLNELIYELSQSIVTIEAIQPVYPNNMIPGNSDAVYNSVSTGLIYDTVGHIITTAAAVVGRSKIVVKFGNIITSAVLKAVDYQSGLAVLFVKKRFGRPVIMSEAQSCAGQMVLALGNAFGLRAAPSIGFCAGYRADEHLQFSATLPSNTYGGGLFTLGGQMVGMISGAVGQYGAASIGLAIPTSRINQIVNHLFKNGTRDAGFLGLSTTEIEVNPPFEFRPLNELTSMAGSRTEVISRGVIVTNVVTNSPAHKAGLQYGDILFKIDERSIISALELGSTIKRLQPGTTLDFDMIRHNRRYKVSVPVGSFANQARYGTPNETPGSFAPLNVNDSLLNEIESLKKMLKTVEDRVNRLR